MRKQFLTIMISYIFIGSIIGQERTNILTGGVPDNIYLPSVDSCTKVFETEKHILWECPYFKPVSDSLFYLRGSHVPSYHHSYVCQRKSDSMSVNLFRSHTRSDLIPLWILDDGTLLVNHISLIFHSPNDYFNYSEFETVQRVTIGNSQYAFDANEEGILVQDYSKKGMFFPVYLYRWKQVTQKRIKGKGKLVSDNIGVPSMFSDYSRENPSIYLDKEFVVSVRQNKMMICYLSTNEKLEFDFNEGEFDDPIIDSVENNFLKIKTSRYSYLLDLKTMKLSDPIKIEK